MTADARDVLAAARDTVADARELQLLAWQQELEARARRLGLVPEDTAADSTSTEPAQAREAAEGTRTAEAAARDEASRQRNLASQERLAARRDTLLAAAFAGVAERLSQARTPEDLMTRIAEAAVMTIAGVSKASITLGDQPGVHVRTDASGAAPLEQQAGGEGSGSEAVLSFPLAAPLDELGTGQASLNVFSGDASALDESARDIGFILAAHAALASRALGERVRLEQAGQQLERALMSRDVIGQAKGILMERLRRPRTKPSRSSGSHRRH